MKINFNHRQSAHCESGVTSNLMTHHGHPISEALAFGIGGGLFFGYFPMVKINHLPLITFRSSPGAIFKRAAYRLGLDVKAQRFRNQDRAMQALDAALAQGIPMGLQTGSTGYPTFRPRCVFTLMPITWLSSAATAMST